MARERKRRSVVRVARPADLLGLVRNRTAGRAPVPAPEPAPDGRVLGLVSQLTSSPPISPQSLTVRAAPETVVEDVGSDVFDVWLADFGTKKIQVIKAVRELTPLSLKDAKYLVDDAPGLVVTRLSRESALRAKALLDQFGATVTLRPKRVVPASREPGADPGTDVGWEMSVYQGGISRSNRLTSRPVSPWT